jgi:hypothetical protein
MSAKPVFLIVGASLTGAKAAEELRTQGFDGRAVVVGAGYVWDSSEHIQALIRAGRPVEAAALADPGTTLESLAGEPAAGG